MVITMRGWIQGYSKCIFGTVRIFFLVKKKIYKNKQKTGCENGRKIALGEGTNNSYYTHFKIE